MQKVLFDDIILFNNLHMYIFKYLERMDSWWVERSQSYLLC